MTTEISRTAIEMAERLVSQPSFSGLTVEQIARNIMRLRELAAESGVHLAADPWAAASEDAISTEIARVSKSQKRRAGVRALVKKYGADSAARIVRKHSGRTIREAAR